MDVLALLGIILVLLKIFAVNQFMIDLSWWWVLLPFYAGLAIWLAILAIGAVAAGAGLTIALIIDNWKRAITRRR